MVPGARSKFVAPMFEPEVFRKQMYCIEESIVALLRVFGAHIDSVPGESCLPRPPVVMPLDKL